MEMQLNITTIFGFDWSNWRALNAESANIEQIQQTLAIIDSRWMRLNIKITTDLLVEHR